MTHIIPRELRDLLERPLIADLATVREDGTPQVNPMWFSWDGELIRARPRSGPARQPGCPRQIGRTFWRG
jgi:predicted pyridoxine 5'-phosphate oxidase superfamily flavin-nucleotide-binding protein